MLRSVVWNLFLAGIPVALGWALAWALRPDRRPPILLGVALPLALAWLVFLPNTCYLLTEWRHLLFDHRWEEMLDTAHTDRRALLTVAKWAFLFLGYSGVGVLLFVLAIRPVERALRARRVAFYAVAPALFFLASLGVYLGLIRRWNSWDLVGQAGAIWRHSVAAVTSPPLLGAIVVFALLLWAWYEAADLWVDALSDRLKAMRRRPRRA